MEGLEGFSHLYGEGKDKASSGIASWVLSPSVTGSQGKKPDEKSNVSDVVLEVQKAKAAFDAQYKQYELRFDAIQLANKKKLAEMEESFKVQIQAVKDEAKKEALEEFQDDLNGLKDRFREGLEDVKEKSIATLAVFVGLFTFVSVDFQLFKKFPDWYAAAGIVFISAGVIIGFVLLTHFLFSKAGKVAGLEAPSQEAELQAKAELKKLRLIGGIVVFSLTMGLILFGFSAWKQDGSQSREDDTSRFNSTFSPSTSIQFTTSNQAASSTQLSATSTR